MAPTTLTLVPTEVDIYPHLGKDDTCIYCGNPQTDEQAENDRTVEHVTRDLVTLHRIREALRDALSVLTDLPLSYSTGAAFFYAGGALAAADAALVEEGAVDGR